MNKLIIWVDTKKAEDNYISIRDLHDCVTTLIKHFEEGKTVIGLPIEFKDILSFEVIEKTDTEVKVEWEEKENV